jgi:ferredoxin
MATMITNDCINCGACEPECPNNAISQGEPVYVIDPKLCTECVGFHDYEACAAVCPVDVCVTDPNNIESEEVLMTRARELHPEVDFPENFESRFRKGQGKAAPGATPVAAATPAVQPGGATPVVSASGTGSVTTLAGTFAEPDVHYVMLPAIDSWNIPLRCYKCNEVQVVNVKNFMIGNVLFCPHCNKSMFVRDNLNYHIRTVLKDAYENWEKSQADFVARRDRERAEFLERRAREARDFETRQQRDLEAIRQQLDAIGENYDAAGKPFKKGSRFAWG